MSGIKHVGAHMGLFFRGQALQVFGITNQLLSAGLTGVGFALNCTIVGAFLGMIVLKGSEELGEIGNGCTKQGRKDIKHTFSSCGY